MEYICRKKKAGSSDAGFCSRNSQTADKGKEIAEALTLRDCMDDVQNDDSITDMPAAPSHNESYGLINKLTMVRGTR